MGFSKLKNSIMVIGLVLPKLNTCLQDNNCGIIKPMDLWHLSSIIEQSETLFNQ
jgi:hypothetical protein